MKSNEAASVLLVAVSVLFFYAVLVADISGVHKFIVEVGLLALCGLGLQKLLGIEGMYGGLIFRTQKGISIMDWLSRWKPELWKGIADFGIAMGFGISSVFLYKKLPKHTYMFGIFALIIVTQIMTPKVFEVISSVISLPMDVDKIVETDSIRFLVTQVVVILATLFFGLGGMTLSAILINGLKILALAISYVLNPALVDLTTAAPGAGPALPGITMPLFEGIIALAILLAVHEASHGILSRIAKVRLESCGVLTFGFIPVGAFVDPDEKELVKKEKDAQTRMFAGGAAANLVVFILSFFAIVAFEIAFYPSLHTNLIVGGVLANSSAALAKMTAGTEIYAINGIPVDTNNYELVKADALSSGNILELETSKGNYSIQPVNGTAGLRFVRPQYKNSALQFLWNTLGLVFVLNLLIGVINLLPVPGFDGYRIVELNTKRKWLLKYLAALVIVAFLMNLLPWLWT